MTSYDPPEKGIPQYPDPSNGLAARIRAMYIEMRSKNPGGVEGFDTPLLFEVIAALEGATTGERQRANSSPTP